ncbi:YciI family protein [Hyphococcus luteus]|nr:YciI family protein [Marinicaulis flavus]
MPHFLVEYEELGNPEAREEKRADHIAYRKGLGEKMPLAGPLLDDQGDPNGSVVILEAENLKDASDLAASDPFVGHGVLRLVSVRPFRIAAMKPPAAR